METTIRINTDMLTIELLEGIKKMFPHKTVEITVQPADATDWILSNPVYAKELEKRINEYESKKNTIVVLPIDLV